MAAPPPPFRRGARAGAGQVPSLTSPQPPTVPDVSVLNNVLSVTPDSLGIRDRQQNFFHSRLQQEKRDSPEFKIQNPGLGILQNPEFGSRILYRALPGKQGNREHLPAAGSAGFQSRPVPGSSQQGTSPPGVLATTPATHRVPPEPVPLLPDSRGLQDHSPQRQPPAT